MRVLLLVLVAVTGWLGISQFQHPEPPPAATASGPVVLYQTAWCPVCERAREHLDARGVDYVARDIDADAEAAADYRAAGGTGAVPLLVIGDEALTGFSAEMVDARLARSGS